MHPVHADVRLPLEIYSSMIEEHGLPSKAMSWMREKSGNSPSTPDKARGAGGVRRRNLAVRDVAQIACGMWRAGRRKGRGERQRFFGWKGARR